MAVGFEAITLAVPSLGLFEHELPSLPTAVLVLFMRSHLVSLSLSRTCSGVFVFSFY